MTPTKGNHLHICTSSSHLHIKKKMYTFSIDSYIGTPITATYVREQLQATQGQPATVLINSLGGDLNTALNIRQQFIDHGAVTVHYAGLSASAATILATGAKHITMSPHALILIHQCLGYSEAWGYYNRDQLQTAIDQLKKQQADLDTIDRVVASIYADRAGTDPKQMAALMAQERWLTADEALQLGLIDEISEAPGDTTATALTPQARAHIAACGYPLPQQATPTATPQPTWLATLIHTLRDLLRPTPNNITNQPPTQMEQTTHHPITAEHITTLLQLDSLQATAEGNVTLTQAQIQAIEAHITDLTSARDQANQARLQAEEARDQAEQARIKAEEALAQADGDDTASALPTESQDTPINASIHAAQFFHKLGSAM